MTALERALVVYAEAKGYEVEVFDEGHQDWEPKLSKEYFNFNFNYRIKTRGDFHKASESLFQCFTGKKTIPEMMENIKKHKPAGFSCKTVTLTREEIEEMNKPKEEEFDVKAYVKSLVQTPEEKERYDKVRPFIMVMEAWAEGKKIECAIKGSQKWVKYFPKPAWNFFDYDYRVSPDPVSIPATEEELEIIGKGVRWCRNKKYPNRMGWVRHNDKLNSSEWYLFDAETKTWQDWGVNE